MRWDNYRKVSQEFSASCQSAATPFIIVFCFCLSLSLCVWWGPFHQKWPVNKWIDKTWNGDDSKTKDRPSRLQQQGRKHLVLPSFVLLKNTHEMTFRTRTFYNLQIITFFLNTCLKKIGQASGQTWDLLVFVYFLSLHKQFLRLLGNC